MGIAHHTILTRLFEFEAVTFQANNVDVKLKKPANFTRIHKPVWVKTQAVK